MVRKKNTFWNNGWTIAIGAVIFAFILSILKDLFTKEPFLSTLKSITIYNKDEPQKVISKDSSKLAQKEVPLLQDKNGDLDTSKSTIQRRKPLQHLKHTVLKSKIKETDIKSNITAKNVVTAPNYGNQQVGDNNTMIITSDKFVEPSESLKSKIHDNLRMLTKSSSISGRVIMVNTFFDFIQLNY